MKLSLDFTFCVMLRFKDFLWRPCQCATADFKKNSNIHKHNSESKRHICPHHDHFIPQAFSFKSPSQILTDSDHLSVLFLLFLIYRLGLMAPMFPSDASEERGGELGSVWSWFLSLLIMRGLPCLTSLPVSLPHAKQMSSAPDDKLHPGALLKFIITGGGEERKLF